MAQFKIAPGESVDVLTKDELRELIDEYQHLFEQQALEDVRASENGATDANGNAAIVVYTVPAGMRFRLTRLVLKADGFTFSAPYAAGGYFEVRRNGQTVDGGPLNGNLPGVGSDGGSAAARFRNGDKVEIAIVGGPATTNFEALIEGDLFPLQKQ